MSTRLMLQAGKCCGRLGVVSLFQLQVVQTGLVVYVNPFNSRNSAWYGRRHRNISREL